MSTETPNFRINNNGSTEPLSNEVMIKDGYVVPTKLHLTRMGVPEPKIPAIQDEAGAIAAGTTYFEIQRRQVARAAGENVSDYPFISNTPEGEAMLAKTLHSRITDYGIATDRWPSPVKGSVITMVSKRFEESSHTPSREKVLVAFPHPQRRAIPAARE